MDRQWAYRTLLARVVELPDWTGEWCGGGKFWRFIGLFSLGSCA